jgi:hypothetical protein
VNWIILGAGWINLDQVVRIDYCKTGMVVSTAFRDFIVTDEGDISRIEDRMRDLAARWLLADPVQADMIRQEVLPCK